MDQQTEQTLGYLQNAANTGIQVGSYVSNKKIAEQMIGLEEQNLARQQAIFDYQKALQKDIFTREDTSVQRRVADLKAAGLSPVLAAGQGARAGEAIKVTAPQRGTAGLKAAMDARMDFANRMLDTQKSMAEIALINAQAKQTSQKTVLDREMHEAEIERFMLDNKFLKDTLDSRIRQQSYKELTSLSENWIAGAKADMANWERLMYKDFYNYVNDEYIKSGKRVNPQIIEYETLKLMQEIKEYDYNWYRDMGLASSGSTNMSELAVSGSTSIIKLIQRLTNAVKKGLTK